MININSNFDFIFWTTRLALSPSGGGALNINISPSDNEGGFEHPVGTLDDRVGVINGSAVSNLLMCGVRRPVSTPTVQWIRNGKFVGNGVITSTTDFSSTLNIAEFTLAEAGEYQCIFIDTDSDAEIITTRPFRLDTGIVTSCWS